MGVQKKKDAKFLNRAHLFLKSIGAKFLKLGVGTKYLRVSACCRAWQTNLSYMARVCGNTFGTDSNSWEFHDPFLQLLVLLAFLALAMQDDVICFVDRVHSHRL